MGLGVSPGMTALIAWVEWYSPSINCACLGAFCSLVHDGELVGFFYPHSYLVGILVPGGSTIVTFGLWLSMRE